MTDTLTNALLEAYRRRGWTLIQLDGKRPRQAGWQSDATQEPQPPRDNVGVVTGSRSGGLVDLDLDTEQSASIANALAPASWLRFGRGGRVTHVVVTVDDLSPDLTRIALNDGSVSDVEVRASRHQTMIPPSVHPDGQSVEWTSQSHAHVTSDEPLPHASTSRVIAFAETVHQLSRVARRAAPGTRHDMALALAGWLYHAGISDSAARSFFAACISASGDEEHTDRMIAFDTTWARAAAGEPVSGIASLRRLLGDDVAITPKHARLSPIPVQSAGGSLPPNPKGGASTPPHGVTTAVGHSEGSADAESNPDQAESHDPDADQPSSPTIARRYIEHTRHSERRLVWYEDEFWTSTASPAWRIAPRGRVRSDIRREISPFAAPTKLGHALSVLEDELQIGRTLWMDDEPPLDIRTGSPLTGLRIPFSNGVLVEGQMTERDANHFYTACSPYPLAADSPADTSDAPAFRKALEGWFGEDHDSRRALLQWYGYVLSGDRSLDKLAAFIGPPRSGKSTAASLLGSLLDPSAVISSSLAMLSQPFGLEEWSYAALALLVESDKPGKRDELAIARSRLLSITGRDPVGISRKNRTSITRQLATRITVISNKAPDIGDSTGAFARRLLLIPFNRPITDIDTSLPAKLEEERPQIAAAAIAAYYDLAAAGDFSVSTETQEEMALELAEATPIRAWAEDHLTFDPQATAAAQQLADSFNGWAETQGDVPLSTRTFSRLFRDTYSLQRRRRSSGIVYHGVRLNG